MGMEFEEGGTVLRILYATLGQRPTKALMWIITGGIILAVARWMVENVEWFTQRFGWVSFSWGSLLDAFVGAVISTVLMLAFVFSIAIGIAVILRFGIDALQRRKLERLAKSFITILEEVKAIIPIDQRGKIDSLMLETVEISNPPLIIRILDKVFPKKKR